MTGSSDVSLTSLVPRIPLLQGVPERDHGKVGALLRLISYDRNDVVFLEGDTGNRVYFVTSGRVKLVHHTDEGRDVVLDVLGPKRVFGIMAVVEHMPYSSSALALEPTVVAYVRRGDFLHLLETYPSVAMRTIRELCLRVKAANDMVRVLATERVSKRIAHILIRLGRITGDDPGTIDLPLTRQDVADMAGTTVETAIRTLSRFRREGYLETYRGRIRILDPEGLLRFAGEQRDHRWRAGGIPGIREEDG